MAKSLDIIGAEGQNRTADTGIFRPKMTILIKPVISVSNMISLAFFMPKKLGNVRLFLEKTDTIGTVSSTVLQTQFQQKKSLAPFFVIFNRVYGYLKLGAGDLLFLLNPLRSLFKGIACPVTICTQN